MPVAYRGAFGMTLLKIAASLYLTQAAIGFVTGFTIPWLLIYHHGGF